jgi:hypothetical protein
MLADRFARWLVEERRGRPQQQPTGDSSTGEGSDTRELPEPSTAEAVHDEPTAVDGRLRVLCLFVFNPLQVTCGAVWKIVKWALRK